MTAMRKIEIGIFRGVPADSGWYRILEQEMPPHRVVDGPDAPIVLFEGEAPDWAEQFVSRGGVAIISGAEGLRIPWLDGYQGYGIVQHGHFPAFGLDNLLLSCCMDLFSAEGWGEIRIHEKRYTKNGLINGRFPLICHQKVGAGHCLFFGAPLTRLLTVLGDTLRAFGELTPITERVSAVDKSKIARILVWTLQKATQLSQVPYPHLWYYPDGAPSVFGFRVDVDGVFPPNLESISKAGERAGFPISFFINKTMCREHAPSLKRIALVHEIGNHADVHNLYDDERANRHNVLQCREWLDSESIPNGPWFVAPRGMWNSTLGCALEDLGYEYSSDFGLDFDGLPFFPRFRGRRLRLLQIPIHPYSVERAFHYCEENGFQEPTEEQVLEHFTRTGLFQIRTCQPVFFYSHPQRFGTMAARVLPRLKEILSAQGAQMTTLARFGSWWKTRDAVQYEAEYDPESTTLVIRGDLPAGLSVNVVSSTVVGAAPGEMKSRLMFNLNKLI
jgi:peptidoglycan/xylan/chitin deacetylase (PgdA/CDA1 family)